MTALARMPTTAPSVASGAVRYELPTVPSSPYIAVSRRILIDGDGAPPWIDEVERKINELLSLEADWDTYGAAPISLEHVVTGLQLLQVHVDADSAIPAIVPTASRGLQFEWETGHGVVEARAGDDGVHIYVEDDTGETEGIATPELASRAAAVIASAALVA